MLVCVCVRVRECKYTNIKKKQMFKVLTFTESNYLLSLCFLN